MIWLWLACTPVEPPEPGAEARFRAALALAATDVEAAGDACLALDDDARRGACLNDWMALTGRHDAERCRALAEGSMWREECLFTTSEQLAGDDPARLAMCGETGRFEPHCLHHTWAAEVLLLVQADGLLVDKMDRLDALVAAWTPRFAPYDDDPGALIDGWFWFRYHQKRPAVSTGVCAPFTEVQQERCVQGTLQATRRLLHDRSRGSGHLRPYCNAQASLEGLELLPVKPVIGDDPVVQAQARSWLERWCATRARGPREWIPDFDPQSDTNGGPVAGTVKHHERRKRQ